MDLAAFFSPEELAAWSDQRVVSHALYATALGIKLLFLITATFTGLHQVIGRWCESIAGKRQYLIDLLYPVLLMLLWSLLILPLEFYSDYIHEHQLGLSTITLGLWWTDWFKDLGMTMLFSAALGVGLFGLARRLPRSWWVILWAAVIGALVLWSMLSPYRARIYHDFTPLQDGPLKQSIESLMKKAGLEIEDIEVVDTSKRSRRANAVIMGEGPTRKVVLTDTLVQNFPAREIAFALAHEAAHEKHDHPTRTWLINALAALLFLGIVRLILWRSPKIALLKIKNHADPAVLPLILLVMQLIFMANNPLSAYLDRQEEIQADQEALDLTRDPAAYCSLMIRLNRQNQTDPDPPALTRWYFRHHPTTRERIQLGFDFAKAENIPLDQSELPLGI